MNYIGNAPAVHGGVPVGMIGWFHAAPTGWLRLNGQALAKATYPDLWAHAQAFLTSDSVADPGLYRSVDAANFVVPNLDGLFVRGQGGNSLTLGKLQADDVKPHTHPDILNMGTNVGAGTGIIGNDLAGPVDVVLANVGVESRPVNVALVPCVRAVR